MTYHGPGQIVGYPILDLDPDRRDVHRYVRDLEETMIRVCADYGISAGRIEGLAWRVGRQPQDRRDWRAHLTLDYEPRLRLQRDHESRKHFNLIVPCGIVDRGVTSLAQLTGRESGIAEVEDRFIDRLR